jgi:hypothetical protein
VSVRECFAQSNDGVSRNALFERSNKSLPRAVSTAAAFSARRGGAEPDLFAAEERCRCYGTSGCAGARRSAKPAVPGAKFPSMVRVSMPSERASLAGWPRLPSPCLVEAARDRGAHASAPDCLFPGSPEWPPSRELSQPGREGATRSRSWQPRSGPAPSLSIQRQPPESRRRRGWDSSNNGLPDAAGQRRTGFWRRGRDSNPRRPCGLNGFQDRRIRPLCHPSAFAMPQPRRRHA